MRLISSRFACVALTALVLAGCTSEPQIINRSKQFRESGDALFAEGNYTDAAGAYRSAIKQDPRDYRAHYSLGRSYEQMHAYHLAIQAYKSSLDTMDTTLEGKENKEFRFLAIDSLSRVIAAGDQRNLERDLAEKQARSRQRASDYLLVAKIHRYAGDADSALDYYNRASLMDPKDFFIAKDYGLYLTQLGLSDRAAAPLRRAYAMNPADEQVNAALRQVGVVPGPSLKDERQLATPPIPKGPIPEWNSGGRKTPANVPSENAPAPRD